MRKPVEILAVVVTGLFTAVCAVWAQDADSDHLTEWTAQQRTKLQATITQNRELKARAEATLVRAESLLHQAQAQNDMPAAAVAQRAIESAQAALARLSAAERQDGARLLALDKVGEWQTQARTLHTDSPTLLRHHAPDIAKGEMAVVTLQRDLYIKQGDDWVPFDGSSPLGPGDQIKTGADGHAEVMLSDGAKIELGEKSALEVTKIGRGPKEESTYQFLKGKVHGIVECAKSISKADRYGRYADWCATRRLTTPTACACVRGTEYSFEIASDGTNVLTVYHGVVDFVNYKQNGKTLKVTDGQQASIRPDGTITAPAAVDLGSISRWWERMPAP